MKACDTTGTQTDAGYAEAAFNWDVSLRLRALLLAQGARVVLTRSSNTGVGPCVNVRAAIGNRAHADAVISIHADGGPADGRGFQVIYAPDAGDTAPIYAASLRLAHAMSGRAPDERDLPAVDLRRPGRLQRSHRPRRAQPLDPPGDLRRARQHAQQRRRRDPDDPADRQRIAVALDDGLVRFLTR